MVEVCDFIDSAGIIVIRPKYFAVMSFSEELASVSVGKHGDI